MKIKCEQCGRTKTTDKDFFVKLVGGVMPVGGFWAWTSYLFAGTGFAMAIVVAIIGGGIAMLLYKDEIELSSEAVLAIPPYSSGTTTNIYELLAYKRKSDESMVMCVDDNHTVLNAIFVLEASRCKVEKTFTGWKVKENSGELVSIGSVDELAMFADECIQVIVEAQRKNNQHYSPAVIFSILSIINATASEET